MARDRVRRGRGSLRSGQLAEGVEVGVGLIAPQGHPAAVIGEAEQSASLYGVSEEAVDVCLQYAS